MNNLSLIPELIATLITVIIALNSHFDGDKETSINQSFTSCIIFSIVAVVISNIASFFLVYPDIITTWGICRL